jgi:serine/threonine-protein kinase
MGADDQVLGADATMLAAAASGPRHAKAQAEPHRRRNVIAVAIALVVVAVAGVGFVLFERMRDDSADAKPQPSSSDTIALPVVVVGANCGTLGAAGITDGGAPAYCAHLPTVDKAIWSLYPGEISHPTATASPNDEVYPSETEAPVLVCMEQTGQTHVDCHDDILQSNSTP